MQEPAEDSEDSQSRSEQTWEVTKILKERKDEYLVEWEGVDPATDKPWEPTWIPRENIVTKELIDNWNREKQAARRKSTRRTSTNVSKPPATPIPPTNRRTRSVTSSAIAKRTSAPAASLSPSLRSATASTRRDSRNGAANNLKHRGSQAFSASTKVPNEEAEDEEGKGESDEDIKDAPVQSPKKKRRLDETASPAKSDSDGEEGTSRRKNSLPVTYGGSRKNRRSRQNFEIMVPVPKRSMTQRRSQPAKKLPSPSPELRNSPRSHSSGSRGGAAPDTVRDSPVETGTDGKDVSSPVRDPNVSAGTIIPDSQPVLPQRQTRSMPHLGFEEDDSLELPSLSSLIAGSGKGEKKGVARSSPVAESTSAAGNRREGATPSAKGKSKAASLDPTDATSKPSGIFDHIPERARPPTKSNLPRPFRPISIFPTSVFTPFHRKGALKKTPSPIPSQPAAKSSQIEQFSDDESPKRDTPVAGNPEATQGKSTEGIEEDDEGEVEDVEERDGEEQKDGEIEARKKTPAVEDFEDNSEEEGVDEELGSPPQDDDFVANDYEFAADSPMQDVEPFGATSLDIVPCSTSLEDGMEMIVTDQGNTTRDVRDRPSPKSDHAPGGDESSPVQRETNGVEAEQDDSQEIIPATLSSHNDSADNLSQAHGTKRERRIEELEQALSQLSVELAAKNNLNTDLQKSLAIQADQLAAAKDEMITLKGNLTSQAHALSAKEKEVELLTESHDKMKKNLSDLVSDMLEQESQIQSQSDKETKLGEELDDARAQLDHARSQLDDARSQLDDSRSHLDDARSQLEALREKMAALERSKASSESDLEYITSMYHQASSSAATLGSENQELSSKNAILEGQKKFGVKQATLKWEGEVQRLQIEVADMQGVVGILQEKAKRTDDGVRQRAAAYSEVVGKLGSTIGQVESLKKQLKESQREVKRLQEREAERERERKMQSREEDSDDDLFLCRAADNSARQRCEQIFLSLDDLETHVIGQHTGAEY
ncbi:hypothetical protein BOTBODRAFT_38215 [Botryobasidium botryosum FD-172 SS1]|uniref:Chromo domain-containing protein n=1 Tax=Botryobasidium botryosum (strain FD-172 SS1) TaxID=930990 RepID=A0A067M8B4_BOTB1|nr:hypothetical protein BOTBODRAFT_38215 [Botryobasidium botryosum FD-172 SS1]